MAMNFVQAQRAAMPDYTGAYLEEQKIKNQIRQAEQMRRQGYFSAGATMAEKVPYSKWQDLGNAMIGRTPEMTTTATAAPTTAGEAAMASTVVDPVTGAVASGVPEAAAGAEALGASGAMSSAAPSAAMGAEAAGAAQAAMAAEAAGAGTAAGTAGASSGMGAALAGLGPIGWLALLGFGLAATDAFN